MCLVKLGKEAFTSINLPYHYALRITWVCIYTYSNRKQELNDLPLV